jgi:FtsZ-binding cell division protein ZapB
VRGIKLHFRGHTLSWIIMSQEEYDLLQVKIKELEEALSKLREQRGSRAAKILRDDLGKAMSRIEGLKVEVEEWKRLNAKLMEEKSVLKKRKSA